jgi:4-hydroxyphenylpyruvate dioxygenase-like putative hemolysin
VRGDVTDIQIKQLNDRGNTTSAYASFFVTASGPSLQHVAEKIEEIQRVVKAMLKEDDE